MTRDLAPVLRAQGAIAVNASDVGDLDRWRRAVRRAGRLLGWRVRTGASGDGLRAWANSPDYALGHGHRDAGDAIDAVLFGDADGRPPV